MGVHRPAVRNRKAAVVADDAQKQLEAANAELHDAISQVLSKRG
jgi:hypothetical protein